MKQLLPPTLLLAIAAAVLVAGLLRPPQAPAQAPLTPERAFRQTCSRCHTPFSPRTYAKDRWRGIVETMYGRASERGIEIDPQVLELAIQHLEASGR